ncbi:MAG: vWA domain-containing protein, partial [Phycisphaerae bacterium]
MNSPISLLAPWSAIVAAAVIPPLVLLYFLKLKRREQPVSSTLLWKRAAQDLQVNSPFQRLRNNLLLLLQILVLLLGVLASTEPIWKRARAREKTLIVLVDQSASMSAVEADGRTRLEKAKELARQMVDDMGDNDQMMIVAFAERARTVASFTNDRTLLKKQIDAIEPTDAPTRLRDALTLAQAYSTPVGEGIGVTSSPLPPAHLILLSDGRIADVLEAYDPSADA